MPKVAQAAQENKIQGYNLPQGVISTALSHLRRGPAGTFLEGRPAYLRRSAARRRQGQHRDERGPRQAGRSRRQGVAVLQGNADQRRVDPRHERRPARQSQHGEGALDARRAGPGNGRAQQRRRRHRAGRAPRRGRLDQSPRRQGSRHPGRLRGRCRVTRDAPYELRRNVRRRALPERCASPSTACRKWRSTSARSSRAGPHSSCRRTASSISASVRRTASPTSPTKRR